MKLFGRVSKGIEFQKVFIKEWMIFYALLCYLNWQFCNILILRAETKLFWVWKRWILCILRNSITVELLLDGWLSTNKLIVWFPKSWGKQSHYELTSRKKMTIKDKDKLHVINLETEMWCRDHKCFWILWVCFFLVK